MSYRTYVNGKQIFGNNDCYPEWLEFIKTQGISVDDECNYTGEITDFMAALDTIERIILRLENERRERKKQLDNDIKSKNLTKEETDILYSSVYGIKSIFDFRNYYDDFIKYDDKTDKYRTSLTDSLMELRKDAYIFMSCMLIEICRDKLEQTHPFSTEGHFNCYKIKQGKHIIVKAS